LAGSVVAEIDATIQHDGCCGERVRVFKVDSLRCGVAVDEEDDACGTGEDGYEVAGYVLFGDFDGPVVRCLRFRHDDTVPYACDSARFDDECVAVVGNDTNPVGTFSNRNPGSLLGGAAIRIGSDRNEITGRGKYLETSAVVDGHIRNR
jgi:hypothetical protein